MSPWIELPCPQPGSAVLHLQSSWARGAEGWPGRTAVIRASAAGRGQLGGAGLYLWRHRALTPELWGGRQLYHQASVIV